MKETENYYSIIIVNHNGKEITRDCLSSLREQTLKTSETIVVDNGSIDSSTKYIRENFPEVKIAESKRNLGFAGGNNLGVKYAVGNWLVFLNNDILVEPEWLKKMDIFITSQKNLGACGCKTMNFYNTDTIDVIGFKIDSFGFPIAIGHLEKDYGQFDNYSPQLFIAGSCFFLKKEVTDRLNEIFDERYFLLSEDLDLSWRVKLLGYDICVNTKTKIFHKSATTFKRMPKSLNTRYLSERNILMNLIKNYSLSSLARISIPYILILFLESMFFLLTLNLRFSFGIQSAIFFNILHLPQTLQRRRYIQRTRKFDTDEFLKDFIVLGSEKIRIFKGLRKNV